MVELKKLVVNNAGTELAYTDSGAPPNNASYITVFAVHGMCFSARKSPIISHMTLLILFYSHLPEGPGDCSWKRVPSGRTEPQKLPWLFPVGPR
jgi:hypothetical protein